MTTHPEKNNTHMLYASCLLLIATIFSVAFQGFDYATGNNIFHIPIIFNYANSAEGPTDIFTLSLSRYISGFWIVISPFVTEKNVFYVFLGLDIAIRFSIIFMVWKISELLGGNSKITAILCSLILFFPAFLGVSPVGMNGILVNYLTHSQAVIPVALGSWYFLLKKRFFIAAAIIGIVFDINAFVGVWSGLVAGIVMLGLSRKKGTKYLMVMTAKMLAVFILVGLPVLLWLVNSLVNVEPYEAFSYRQYLREYYPYHNFIDTHIQPTIAMSLAIVTSFFALKHIRVNWTDDYRRIISLIFYTYSIIFFIGMIFPYVTDSRLLLNLYPLRMDSYIIYLGAILIFSWCIKSFSSAKTAEKSYALVALFSLFNGNIILLLVTIILAGEQHIKSNTNRLAASSILLLLMGAANGIFGDPPVLENLASPQSAASLVLQGGIIAFFLPRNATYIKHAGLLIAAAVIGALPAFDNNMLRVFVFLTYAVLIFCLISKKDSRLPLLLLLFMFAVLVLSTPGTVWKVVVPVVVLLPVFFMYIAPYINKYGPISLITDTRILAVIYIIALIGGAGQMYSRGGLSRSPDDMQDFKEVQLWARHHTPPHTIFLPVGVNGFSTLSRRPVWIDWKIGAMVMWAPETYKLWSTRWKQLRQVKSISGANHLAQKEGIKFIVFNKDKITSDNVFHSCIAYENKHYWIMYSAVKKTGCSFARNTGKK